MEGISLLRVVLAVRGHDARDGPGRVNETPKFLAYRQVNGIVYYARAEIFEMVIMQLGTWSHHAVRGRNRVPGQRRGLLCSSLVSNPS